MLGLVYIKIKSLQILLADFRAVAIKQNVFSTAVSKQENETKVILSVKSQKCWLEWTGGGLSCPVSCLK